MAPMAAVRSNDVAFVILTDTRVNSERFLLASRRDHRHLDHAGSEFTHVEPAELEAGYELRSLQPWRTWQPGARPSGAMAGIVMQWATPLRRSQALTDPGEALRALTNHSWPFTALATANLTRRRTWGHL
jgi:hypothetical protein